MKKSFIKIIASYLAVAMFVIGMVPKVHAGFVPSGVLMLDSFDRTADLHIIQEALEQKIVQERLAVLGFSSDEIQQRLAQLTDEQLHSLAQNIDQLNVGGNGLGIVIALLVIAILVVLLIKLTGHNVVVR